jgi:hypothetical protein
MNATRMNAIEDGAEPTRCETLESLLFAAGTMLLAGLGTACVVWNLLGAVQ